MLFFPWSPAQNTGGLTNYATPRNSVLKLEAKTFLRDISGN